MIDDHAAMISQRTRLIRQYRGPTLLTHLLPEAMPEEAPIRLRPRTDTPQPERSDAVERSAAPALGTADSDNLPV